MQLRSEITRGTVLMGELYAHRIPKVLYMHIFQDFLKDISSMITSNTDSLSNNKYNIFTFESVSGLNHPWITLHLTYFQIYRSLTVPG